MHINIAHNFLIMHNSVLSVNIKKWRQRSTQLLHKAITDEGIRASCCNTTNYSAVFSRDAAMAGIAGLLENNDKIIEGLVNTVKNLHKFKGPQGQIPSNYTVAKDGSVTISYGTLSPKIDAATWYLVALGLLIKKGYDFDISFAQDTIQLLEGIEYNAKNLIYVPQGGNWADEYPIEGYTLYDQVLRCWALSLLGKGFNQELWLKKSNEIKKTIKLKYADNSLEHLIASYKPGSTNTTFDLAAHCLLAILLTNEETDLLQKPIKWVEKTFINYVKLPPAFYPIIDKNSKFWEDISNFHLYEFKNKPHHYHNGGIWFIWIGWYALMLKKCNKIDQLENLSSMVFDIIESNKKFDFDEYLSSDNNTLGGTKELCFTATGIIFICNALELEIDQLNWLLEC